MKPTSYKIHLPNGHTIDAKDAHNLEIILSMNVCRVYQSQQIRIEPVWPTREALGVSRDHTDDILNKVKNFRSSLRNHERDCKCSDCYPLY